MTKIEPEIDPAVRVPELPERSSRAWRLIGIVVALVVLLALVSQLLTGVFTVPRSAPASLPPAQTAP